MPASNPYGLQGVEVEYSEEHWRLLREKRRKAAMVMRALQPLQAEIIVHGSVARGDVREDSDIDVVVVNPVQPSLIELALEKRGLRPFKRVIVQATPLYVPKVYFILDPEEEMVVSTPLAPLRPREREFYKWGGELDLKGVLSGKRVPGVNKELVLIIPTERGHMEVEIQGIEGLVARILGVSIETVMERVKVLTRRREKGHTGLYLEVEVPPGVPVEEVLRELRWRDKLFRRRSGL
ncbi:MAG: nucleotidyltransferase domain-containing protein [Desulfurococcales archaeon]|nr:nucleotidyltransferase domain-containing protein [Desulfurococcales archaeon]